jgi:hypothetical protein
MRIGLHLPARAQHEADTARGSSGSDVLDSQARLSEAVEEGVDDRLGQDGSGLERRGIPPP